MISSRAWSLFFGSVALVVSGCGESPGAMNPDGGTASDAMTSADSGVWRSSVRGIPPYSEPVCDPTADLAEVAAAYQNTPEGLRTATLGIAARRYPIGTEVINVQSDPQLQAWFRNRATFMGVLEGFDTAVHEGTHIWDITMIGAQGWPYRVRDDLVIRARRLTNFNRSEIVAQHVNAAMDQYVKVYLTGQSGMQGFNTLLDEYNAYAHSLASRYCTRDSLASGTRISARDGILTMMYYVEVYLRLARTNHPQDYAAIIGDPGHLQLIRTVWGRAEFWLNLSAQYPQLGLRDATIRGWVYDANNLGEIERLP